MASLAGLHPEVRGRVRGLIREAEDFGVRVTITSTDRSRAQQQRLYDAWLARGRTGYPVAVPGRSTHEYGVAVDLVVDPPERLAWFAQLAECWGLKWAGARDRVHFDVFGWDAWNAILAGRPFTVRYEC